MTTPSIAAAAMPASGQVLLMDLDAVGNQVRSIEISLPRARAIHAALTTALTTALTAFDAAARMAEEPERQAGKVGTGFPSACATHTRQDVSK